MSALVMRLHATIAGHSTVRGAALAAIMLIVASSHTTAMAQDPKRLYHVGHLAQSADSLRLTRDFTLPELAKLGFVEGANLRFSERTGAADKLPSLALDLIATKPDAIIAIGAVAVQAARAVTSDVPIVMFADDPVGLGFAQSLARPGGNVTGIANMVEDLVEKRMDLLLESVPKAERVAALLRRTSPNAEQSERALRNTIKARGKIELLVYHVDSAPEYQGAFAAMHAANAEAVLIGNDPLFYSDRQRLASLATEAGLPSMCEWAIMTEAGCLLGYSANQGALRRRMASYISAILRGHSPSELPIEQPTHFEFAVNIGTAKALGIPVPSSILQRADDVIE